VKFVSTELRLYSFVTHHSCNWYLFAVLASLILLIFYHCISIYYVNKWLYYYYVSWECASVGSLEIQKSVVPTTIYKLRSSAQMDEFGTVATRDMQYVLSPHQAPICTS
jgi:hypothetical protein